jgi:hypothetical protein
VAAANWRAPSLARLAGRHGIPRTTTHWRALLAGCTSPTELLRRLSRNAIPLPPAAPLVLQEAAGGRPGKPLDRRAGGSSPPLRRRRARCQAGSPHLTP